MRTLLSAGDIPGPIQLPGMTGFILQVLHGSVRPNSEKQQELCCAHIRIKLAPESICTTLVCMTHQFNLVTEFLEWLSKSIASRLPPLRLINHNMVLKTHAKWTPDYHTSGDRFSKQITNKIEKAEATAKVYKADDKIDAKVVLTTRKHDRPEEPMFLQDCRERNENVEPNYISLANITQAIEVIVSKPIWFKIDLTDSYYNIRIDPDSDLNITFGCQTAYYQSHRMHQGDTHAPAMVV